MEESIFFAGSTPINVFIPKSANGLNKTPSLQPNSKTLAFSISRNRSTTSDA